MTHRLEQAISALQNLPEPEQDAMATLILDQITDDLAWDEALRDRRISWRKLPAKRVRTWPRGEFAAYQPADREFATDRRFPVGRRGPDGRRSF